MTHRLLVGVLSAGLSKSVPTGRAFAFLCMFLLGGCAQEYAMFHSVTGQPILVIRRATTTEGCFETMREEAARLVVTFRYVHVKGSYFGDSLLWPFVKGYSCEAAIGPERSPRGVYPYGSLLLSQG